VEESGRAHQSYKREHEPMKACEKDRMGVFLGFSPLPPSSLVVLELTDVVGLRCPTSRAACIMKKSWRA